MSHDLLAEVTTPTSPYRTHMSRPERPGDEFRGPHRSSGMRVAGESGIAIAKVFPDD